MKRIIDNMRAYTPLFLTNIIERDDGKKKQIMEKAPAVACF